MMLKVKPKSAKSTSAPESEMGMASTTEKTELSLPKKIRITNETTNAVISASLKVSCTVALMKPVVSPVMWA